MATIDRSGARKSSDGVHLDRLPPQNLEAEQGVLGSILLDPEVTDEVSLILRPQQFYARENQTMFEHLLAMHNEGGRIDTLLLIDRLKKFNVLEAIGGLAYITQVVRSVPTASHATHYAEIVRDKATLRALIHAGTDILSDAYDESHDARELLSRAEEKVFAILEDKGSGDLASMQDVLYQALDRIDSRLKKGGGSAGLETNFTELDAITGGLHASELIILAARPSMGKTALAANIAENIAVRLGAGVLFVSLEMSRLELAERMLCSHGRINGHKLRNGIISTADHRKLIEASNTMSSAPLFIDDSPSRTMTEIAATARRLKRREQLGLIVIDYLQLIEPDNSKDPRQEQVAKIARRLKGMARELRVPVLCLAQLNRQAEASRDNRPRLSHLRESGAIEQDADVVMFVHREEYYATNDEDRERAKGQAEIIIAKQRNGPIGDIKIAWLSDFTRFDNLAQGEAYNFGEFT